ncbi:magnesium transporter [Desulfitispora alkaliphila]|uniref:magnesium transporter n=1 Tax=Desulfitispora alkaliphila TaxID=622674 RepID=UPI003D1A1DD2
MNYMDSLTEIKKLLKQDKLNQLEKIVERIQPFDLALITNQLKEKERKLFFSALDDQTLAEIFQMIDEEKQVKYIREMGVDRAASILNWMPNDEVADLIILLEDDQKKKLFSLMSNEDEDRVKKLLQYPETSAGGLMTTEFAALTKEISAKEALEQLKKQAKKAETIYYIYIVDDKGILLGVMSLRDLILAYPDHKLADVMNSNVLAIPPELDQEGVADLIEKYDLIAIPVVDIHKKLLGIVTVDDIIDVLQDEATEDISKLSGLSGEANEIDTVDISSGRAARKRLPWLMILLVVGILSGTIISHFEETLEAVVILAIFIPLIADMAGNTGTQSLAVVVRGLALGQFGKGTIFKLIKREAGVGLIIGTVNGISIALIAYLWQGNPYLGLVIGLSLWITLIVATLTGAVVPLILNRLRVDPAVASGPFITTVNDIIGLTVYFSIATSFMEYL